MAGVFVTGGSGFIGGRLTERLCSDGHRVRALARSDAAAETVRRRGAEAVPGDLADVAAMRGAPTAASSRSTPPPRSATGDGGRTSSAGNVDGSRNALRACREAGVGELSTSAREAPMAGRPLVDVDESAPLRPDSPALYSSTKAHAEMLVLAANSERFQTVVVRPRFVWGAGDTTLLPVMVEMVRAGRFAWIAGGRHRTSTTHVENVVEGLVLGARHGQPGNAYFVTDGAPVVFHDFVARLLGTQGVRPPERSIPAPVAGAVAAAGESAWRILPLPGRPPLTRFAYWVSSQECTIRIDKAVEQLGYRPRTSIADGLAELSV